MTVNPTTHKRRLWMQKRAENGGLHLYVDAAPLRELIQDWYEIGFRSNALAAALDVNERTIDRVRDGLTQTNPRELISRASTMTVREIIAAAPDDARVPHIGISRRLQGLVFMGHPLKSLPLSDWVKRLSSSGVVIWRPPTAAHHRAVAE